MYKFFYVSFTVLMLNTTFAQSVFPKNQLSVNGFRNPSIGLEYQRNNVSIHAGYYVTNFESGVTTEFFKTGLTFWVFPIELSKTAASPSSFYVSGSYALGTSRDYKDKNAAIAEVGFRWFIWKGLNFRLGVAALSSEGQDIKINPTPGLSYTFKF